MFQVHQSCLSTTCARVGTGHPYSCECVGVGRAAGLTAAGFLVGSLLGGALQNWLRVDIVPIGVRATRCTTNMRFTVRLLAC